MDPCQSCNSQTNKHISINVKQIKTNKWTGLWCQPTSMPQTLFYSCINYIHDNEMHRNRERKRREKKKLALMRETSFGLTEAKAKAMANLQHERDVHLPRFPSFVFILVAVRFCVLNRCKLLWNVAFYRDLSLNQFDENCVFCVSMWMSLMFHCLIHQSVYWTYAKTIIASGLVGHLSKRITRVFQIKVHRFHSHFFSADRVFFSTQEYCLSNPCCASILLSTSLFTTRNEPN